MRKYLAKKMIEKSTKNASIRGVSLTEVLFATALTGVVIAAAGYGVSSLVTSSNAASARSDRRAEQNRSLDFISSEIRESTSIEKNASTATVPSGFTPLGTGATNVLMIKTATTGLTPIIYYTATPAAGSWKGPRVLYRWGPPIDNRGNYTTAAWTHEVLIDNIAAASGATTTVINGGTGTGRVCSTTDNASNGGTYNGDSGFNACVDAAGRTAVIRQDGQVAKIGAAENYIASTNTGARRIIVQSPTSSPFPNGASADWTLSGGTVTTTKPLKISVRYLGGDIVCGNAMYPIPTFGSVTLKTGSTSATTTNLNMTANADTIFSNVAANTTMTISGKAVGNSGSSSSCNGSTYGPYSSTNTTQVRSLKSGDDVPPTKGYLGQASIDAYLTSASTNPATNRPIVNTTTRKIDLAANQVIYLYEFGSTDTSSAAFDLQDMVVLATFQ